MSDNVQLPALGESVTEGTVTRWLKNIGDTVAVDEPLLEISTDKVDTEIPSPFAGVLEQILVQEDETVEVGATLAVIGSGEGSGDAGSGEQQAPAEQAAEPAAEQAPAEEPAAEQSAQQPVEEHEDAPAPAAPSGGGGGQEVTLPALGESVTEGTVTRWLKAVGDEVAVDEPLLEISTDKVDTEIPSPVAGTLQEIRVQEDETVEVGAVLAVVGSGDAAAAPAAEQPAAPAQSSPAPEQAAASAQDAPQDGGEAPTPQAEQAPAAEQPAPAAEQPAAQASAAGSYLTPLVRKLATEKGVDVSTLTGSGVGGRIRKEDVLEAAAKAEEARKAADAAKVAPAPAASTPAPTKAATPQVSPLRGTTEKASRLRQIIAERMVEALHTQAQLTTVVEVDVTRIARLRARAKDDFKAREGVNLTFLPFFVQAAVEALKTYPKVNGVLEDKTITYHGQENVGIAVDTERGLLVPVIRDAGDLNIAGISRKIADLAARTRANKVTPDELSGATFTVTNTGSGGAIIDTPIVPGGTSAILGTGAIVKRPVVVKDADGAEVIAIRSMCYLCLSYDHRLVDGADASRYLTAVKNRLEEGAFEAELGL
ncbi:2-oxoglutarate dehydrogenase, E2 component, dihydrolipoamide succinyltransferase [Cellulomonas xiejunii]|uniref:Dihydrolipoamide acetyltransferase component of pyruvate dehydrogenase complex n=1 Tax=Cellulomonas xiejunii TaxID=2968083 RepID=A0ABY5KIX8_9CELL|nr:2-oxoglutarate dehydrogenase, E2 component, dihydrolipoamide succinyltransferase [Cellulomonas xiejunii]MCC2319961.1 2-oxoglutarate dehydrogenase, E2 component, dihydrolipoamide succinyltransferase [Cellulomonas xiejunii]UUI70280.1 2-oxoglutarate dehydrogenase, E2 component, dihydrolipoamide succinyltransferase [Cellulomonas xiejunii]